MSEERQRLFVALWPNDLVRQQLAAAIPQPTEAGRAIPLENLHVTLAFLGDVATSRIPELGELAASLSWRPFTLSLVRLEVWNRSLVCLVPDELPEQLAVLARNVSRELQARSFEVDARDYRAHVTLIRERRRGARKPLMQERRDGDRLDTAIVWDVDEIALVRSRTSPAGSRYEVIGSWPARDQ